MNESIPRPVLGVRGRIAVLVAVVVALGIGLGAGVHLTGGGADGAAGPQGDWPALAPVATERIILEGPGGVFSLVRAPGVWRVRMPDRSDAPLADAARVAAFLEFLSMNRPIRTLDEGAGPADFTPRAAVTLDGWGRIEIGPEDGSGVGVFARVGGRPGFVVLSSDYVDVLSRGPEHYLDLRLMPMDPERVQTARLSSMDATWEIRRTQPGFAFVRPEVMAAARVRTESMALWLHELSSLKGHALAAAPPEKGRRPDLAIGLVLRGGVERWLKLWLPLDDSRHCTVLSSRQDVYFLLDQERVEKLERNAFSLVDRRLVALDLGRVHGLVLSGGGRELLAHQVDGIWRAEGGTPLTGIDMRLWRLTDLQYEYGPVGALPATAREALRLGLLDDKGQFILKLVFYEDPGLAPGRCWAARDGEKAFHPVDNRLYKDLQGQLPPATGTAAQD